MRVLHWIFKRKKTLETMRLQAEWFKCFRAVGNPMKHDAQVFEITSPTKEITISITFFKSNIFCPAHGCSDACESCEEALIGIN